MGEHYVEAGETGWNLDLSFRGTMRNEEGARNTRIERCKFRTMSFCELEKVGISHPGCVPAPLREVPRCPVVCKKNMARPQRTDHACQCFARLLHADSSCRTMDGHSYEAEFRYRRG